MRVSKEQNVSRKSIIVSLIWGMVAGQALVLAATFISMRTPLVSGPRFLFINIVVGLAAGSISYLSLINKGWFPKTTWLLLSFIAWICIPVGSFISGLVLGLFLQIAVEVQFSLVSQTLVVIGPLLAFGLWLIVAYYSVTAIRENVKHAQNDDEVIINNAKAVAVVVLMISLAVFTGFSNKNGLEILMLMAATSLLAMIALAIYGTRTRPIEHRSLIFLTSIWVSPAITFGVILFMLFSS